MTLPYLLPLTLFPFALIFAGFSDLFTMRISNKVSLALIIGFFCAAFLKDMSLEAVYTHIGLAFLTLCFTLYSFAKGYMGGADAKLAPAIVLWLGTPHLAMSFLLFTAIFGGLLAIILIKLRDYPLPALLARQEWLLRLHSQTTDIPYGINLALAGLIVFTQSFWLN
jgi:prepilin peptidase CpaA